MKEKIESEKSKMENKIHEPQRKEDAAFRIGFAMMGTPLWKRK
jgi:hypothetical protein